MAKLFSALTVIWLVVFGLLPTGSYLMHTLESRFPEPQELPQDIDGIIILGGALNVLRTSQYNTISLNDNAERLTVLLRLKEAYSSLPIIFTGGAGKFGYPDLSEADMIKPLLNKLVADPDLLIYENNSRNTYENALFTRQIIDRMVGRKWLLITSARHMPRSVGAFRHQNIDVVPYPVDYRSLPDFRFSLSSNPITSMTGFRTPLHEWLGLFAYYLTDKSSELFPSPK